MDRCPQRGHMIKVHRQKPPVDPGCRWAEPSLGLALFRNRQGEEEELVAHFRRL